MTDYEKLASELTSADLVALTRCCVSELAERAVEVLGSRLLTAGEVTE